MAKMITVYFATDTDPAKAIIDIERLEFFVSLGAMRTAIEASEKKDLPEKQCDKIESTEQPSDENDDNQIETINPDQGFGLRFKSFAFKEGGETYFPCLISHLQVRMNELKYEFYAMNQPLSQLLILHKADEPPVQ